MKYRTFHMLAAMCALLTSVMVYAGNTEPELVLSGRPDLNAGTLRVDKVAVRGSITCQGEHDGFKIWMNAGQTTNTPERYIIRGKNNPENTVKVILSGDNWVSDSAGNGVIKQSRDRQASFNVVAEANQFIFPDEYALSLNGVCMKMP